VVPRLALFPQIRLPIFEEAKEQQPMNPNSSLIDRAGLDRAKVTKLM
jgi:hypothetical protein